jgi:hypothetical protein
VSKVLSFFRAWGNQIPETVLKRLNVENYWMWKLHAISRVIPRMLHRRTLPLDWHMSVIKKSS